MENRNIQMKKKNNNVWDNLYPISLNENIFNTDGLSLNEQLEKIAQFEKNSEPEDTLTIKQSQYSLESSVLSKQKENTLNNVLRVASFNVQSISYNKFDYLQETKNIIHEAKPHICGLQEMISGSYFDFDQSMRSKPFPFTFFTENVKNYRNGEGHSYGIGLISGLGLSNKYSKMYTMLNEKLEKRSFQRVSLNVNGTNINFYNTHLTNDNESEINNQLSQLYDDVVSQGIDKVVIVGDFNTQNMSLFNNFKNLGFKFMHTGELPTFHGGTSPDNILISNALDFIDTGMLTVPSNISDHNLIYADIGI